MIGGVNFQPGQIQGGGTQPKPKQGNSVQEAIKILSLRLPKQVGPNALAPAALLNSQGSGGNPRVDSVVNTVMGRMFPTGDAPAPAAPMVPSGPQSPIAFDGNTRPPDNTPLSSMMPTAATTGPAPPRFTPGTTVPGPGYELPPDLRPAPNAPDQPGAAPPVLPAPTGPSAPPEPTQDPWNDLMEYLRRREPAPPQETPSI